MANEASLIMWPAAFLVIALHGLVLCFLFCVRNAGRKRPNRLLGSFLLLSSINLIGCLLYLAGFITTIPYLLALQGAFQMLYGPLLYFYVLSVMDPAIQNTKQDLVHFSPFFFCLVWMIPLYVLQDSSQPVAFLEPVIRTGFATQTLSMIFVLMPVVLLGGYTLNVLKLISGNSRHGTSRLPDINLTTETCGWIRLITGALDGCILIFFVSHMLLLISGTPAESILYIIMIALSLFIFGVGYVHLINPDVLKNAHNGKSKYENSSLSTTEAKAHLEKLLDYMNAVKPYLDGDLKLDNLADRLSIPSHHLSQIINERLEKNFYEFVNGYRVQEAKRIFSDPQKKKYKILRVALESGFNNKTSFNTVFKKEVGMTPSEFRKKQLNGFYH